MLEPVGQERRSHPLVRARPPRRKGPKADGRRRLSAAREAAIQSGLAAGKTNREIAEEAEVSISTVRRRRRKLAEAPGGSARRAPSRPNAEDPRIDKRRLSLYAATCRLAYDDRLSARDVALLLAVYGSLLGAVTWLLLELSYS